MKFFEIIGRCMFWGCLFSSFLYLSLPFLIETKHWYQNNIEAGERGYQRVYEINKNFEELSKDIDVALSDGKLSIGELIEIRSKAEDLEKQKIIEKIKEKYNE